MTNSSILRVLTCLLLLSSPAIAAAEGDEDEDDVYGEIPEPVDISEDTVKGLLSKKGYKRIQIIEIDYEIYQGQKVYEADFKYRGRKYESAISLNKKVLYVEQDLD